MATHNRKHLKPVGDTSNSHRSLKEPLNNHVTLSCHTRLKPSEASRQPSRIQPCLLMIRSLSMVTRKRNHLKPVGIAPSIDGNRREPLNISVTLSSHQSLKPFQACRQLPADQYLNSRSKSQSRKERKVHYGYQYPENAAVTMPSSPNQTWIYERHKTAIPSRQRLAIKPCHSVSASP